MPASNKNKAQSGAAPTPTVKGRKPARKTVKFNHKNASTDPELNAPR